MLQHNAKVPYKKSCEFVEVSLSKSPRVVSLTSFVFCFYVRMIKAETVKDVEVSDTVNKSLLNELFQIFHEE